MSTLSITPLRYSDITLVNRFAEQRSKRHQEDVVRQHLASSPSRPQHQAVCFTRMLDQARQRQCSQS